jgi:hypothetical protein
MQKSVTPVVEIVIPLNLATFRSICARRYSKRLVYDEVLMKTYGG